MEKSTREIVRREKDIMDEKALSNIQLSIVGIEKDIEYIKKDLAKDVDGNKKDIEKVKRIAYGNKDRINKYFYMVSGMFGVSGFLFGVLKMFKVF